MARYQVIKNARSGAVVLERARLAVTFWEHFRGLMLAAPLSEDEGVLFITRRDNRTETSIHMFFVRYDLGVVWVNSAGIVVDKKLARRWRPYYAPAQPARYFIEANPSILDRVVIGDHLQFEDIR
ncbi:MAG: DUF192 domain-containing protein [Anaerolinea sp.]|nr:DUF192 domain-containing protein [Anaerolinea sp.]